MKINTVVPKLEKKLRYGTCGFRMKYSSILDHVVYVCGIVGNLRSKTLKGKTIGIMITASHNPKEDNGVKIVDPTGEYIPSEWEKLCEILVNCKSIKEIEEKIKEVIATYKIDLNTKSTIFVGYDSRKSSEGLFECCKKGIESIKFAKVVNLGLVTTPILHYLVLSHNRNEKKLVNADFTSPDFYYKMMMKRFKEFMELDKEKFQKKKLKYIVDTANGVGSVGMRALSKMMKDFIDIEVINGHENVEELNLGCGTDYVVVKQDFPANYSKEKYDFVASFDGDGDRLVFSFHDKKDGSFQILDGDKISSLLTLFISKIMDVLKFDLSVGVVQTAYANGSSSRYLESVLPKKKESLYCVKTGVKYLHHQAKKLDIGIYFEANGHGTVIFSDKAWSLVSDENIEKYKDDKEKYKHIKLLKGFMNLINPATGDAIGDLLGVIGVLFHLDLDYIEWSKFYSILPYVLHKTVVKDRTLIKTNIDETKVLEPKGLQEEIDKCVKLVGDKKGRTFVRPSGTEDVVRIYSEGTTLENANKIVEEVEKVVKKYL